MMTPDDIAHLCKLLRERVGLVLSPDKAYLLESRLSAVVRARGMADLAELIAALRAPFVAPALLDEVTDAMTTNESFFFRDTRPFDQFRETVLPYLLRTRAPQRRIRIWSAACSSGQEPYSLAMILREEAAALQGWRVDILATDISSQMLDRAISGIYSEFEVNRGLSAELRDRYFRQQETGWEIDGSLRSMIGFQTFNLMNDPDGLGNFDVVFCRNVLIYFDQERKSAVLAGIQRQMPADGFLFLGGAETVLGLSEDFVPIPGMRGIYSISPPELATGSG